MENSSLLVEEGREHYEPTPKSGLSRRSVIAIALGAAGTLCFAGQRMTKREHPFARFVKVRDSFMSAFSNRALTEEGNDIEATFNFAFGPKEFEGAMKVDYTLKLGDATTDQEAPPPPEAIFLFKAKTGEAEALTAALEEVKTQLLEAGKQWEVPEEEIKAVSDAVTITAESEGDLARIELVSPMGSDEETEEADQIAELLRSHDPKFEGSVRFGRSFTEMFGHAMNNKPIVTVPGGISCTNHMKFTGGFLSMVGEILPPTFGRLLPVITAFTDVTESFGFHYEDEAKLDSALESFPELSIGHLLRSLADSMTSEFPAELLDAVKALPDSADGFESLSLKNLPGNWEIDMTFENFHVTPVLKALLSPPARDEAEEEAGAPSPGDEVPPAGEEAGEEAGTETGDEATPA